MERMQLVSLNDTEQSSDDQYGLVIPIWSNYLEEAQYTITKLKSKIQDLMALHTRHLHKPTFDESNEEEMLIESCTSEITSMFNSVHRLIQFIKSNSLEGKISLSIIILMITLLNSENYCRYIKIKR